MIKFRRQPASNLSVRRSRADPMAMSTTVTQCLFAPTPDSSTLYEVTFNINTGFEADCFTLQGSGLKVAQCGLETTSWGGFEAIRFWGKPQASHCQNRFKHLPSSLETGLETAVWIRPKRRSYWSKLLALFTQWRVSDFICQKQQWITFTVRSNSVTDQFEVILLLFWQL